MHLRRLMALAVGLAGGLCALDAHAQILALPEVFQEQGMWCWAGTTRAVLLFYGRDVAECALANDRFRRELGQPELDCCQDPSFCDSGYDGVTFLLVTEGAAGHYLSKALSVAEVQAELAAGHPFYIRWAWAGGFSGHWLVGHGLSGEMLYYLDPLPGEGLKIAAFDWVVHSDQADWIGSVTTSQGCLGAADGAPCDDESRCTDPDTCHAQRCVGTVVVTCPAGPTCELNYCDANTGLCRTNELSDIPCDDGDACTLGDVCLGGQCVASSRVPCPAPGICQTGGDCDARTGLCTDFVAKPDGTSCDDGSACTLRDVCAAGQCVGVQKPCGTFECHVPNGCDAVSGKCNWTRAADGTACAEGSCVDGACRKPVTPDAGIAPPASAKGCASAGGTDRLPLLILVALAVSRRRRLRQ